MTGSGELNLILVAMFITFSLTQARYEIKLSDKYILGWEFTVNQKSIIFDAVVETKGYVGLGLSETGTMEGADIFIAGYNSEEENLYYADYYATRNGPPTVDPSQDWFLGVATENETHTALIHDRFLDTSDSFHDIIIQDEGIYLIWAIGASDELEYHLAERGSVFINLLNPSVEPTTTRTTTSDGTTTTTSGGTTLPVITTTTQQSTTTTTLPIITTTTLPIITTTQILTTTGSTPCPIEQTTGDEPNALCSSASLQSKLYPPIFIFIGFFIPILIN